MWGLTRIMDGMYGVQKRCSTDVTTFNFKYQSLFDVDCLKYFRLLIFEYCGEKIKGGLNITKGWLFKSVDSILKLF